MTILVGMNSRNDYKFYDWSAKWHFEHNMIPYLEELYKAGDLLNHKPDKNRLELAKIKSIRAIYDGEKMLTEIVSDIFTEPNEKLFGDANVASYQDYVNNFVPALISLDNGDDVIALINHKQPKAKFAYGDIKNYYTASDTNGKYISTRELVAKLPLDFMDYNCRISPDKIGHGTKVLLLTTAVKDVDAVTVKSSEYVLGSKIVHIRNGEVIRESFAKPGRIEKEQDGTEIFYMTIEKRDYTRPKDEQVSQETQAYRINNGKFTPFVESEDNTPNQHYTMAYRPELSGRTEKESLNHIVNREIVSDFPPVQAVPSTYCMHSTYGI